MRIRSTGALLRVELHALLGFFILLSGKSEPVMHRETRDNFPQRENMESVSLKSPRQSWWRVRKETMVQGQSVDFTIHMRQCNQGKLESIALSVSDPQSSEYGKYLTAEEAHTLVRCPNHEIQVLSVKKALTNAALAVGADLSFKELGNSIAVHTSREALEYLLQAPIHSFVNDAGITRLGVEDVDALSELYALEGIQLVTGLTEIPRGRKYSVQSVWSPRAGGGIPGEVDAYTNFTNMIVTPRLIRELYNVPDSLIASAKSTVQGVAAFDDFFVPSDLCNAHNLLATQEQWLNAPNIQYFGQEFDPDADEAESDLDTQYITVMAPGVRTLFVNHEPGKWILDWAIEASSIYAPSNNGPTVWSISYGWPEQCSANGTNGCSNEILGYDEKIYMHMANNELAKLASMGVSVLVSSGDDGSPGFGATCPPDPSYPIDPLGGELDGILSTDCPFKEGCGCAGLEIYSADASCILPLGFGLELFQIGVPGTDCSVLLDTESCATAMYQLFMEQPTSCEYALLNNVSFYSTCQCKEIPSLTYEGCTVKGYTFDNTRYQTAFTPDFPTSSPWVTSIGATQIRWDLEQSCGQSDIMSDLSSAETAVNAFTGGFDGGGGFSMVYPAHPYQAEFINKYTASDVSPPPGTYNKTNRGYPDISALGHNFLVVISGRPSKIGGTSASAPTLAGLISLLNDKLAKIGRSRLGFLNPLLYHMASDNTNVFKKIRPRTYDLVGTVFETILGTEYTVGGNFCSRFACCEVGYMGTTEEGSWDAVTGLGAIDFAAFAEYVGVGEAGKDMSDGADDLHVIIGLSVAVAFLSLLLVGMIAVLVRFTLKGRDWSALEMADRFGRAEVVGDDEDDSLLNRNSSTDESQHVDTLPSTSKSEV